ncbi:MAG: phosphocarrier protein HPr [Candidatus Glassbacteria bacterium RBG_16_58_8]|uniref:Phosphocarrier protein HPr n=1 Tax=Candidatus Glassbacteria bacterium RBG_16_58_8 TaxID=1817866 RepID=A0A1F5YC23_9BACT|nr:MAG: phosphocarrier protein HPr [Candidatus Glassbacteria bacterium RBG_16_58_8]
MVEVIVTIGNELGLHARPAALFVQRANKYKSEIFVRKDDMEVNGKSIMSVMMLAAESGTEIVIRAVGEDEDAAIHDLRELIESKFGEDRGD